MQISISVLVFISYSICLAFGYTSLYSLLTFDLEPFCSNLAVVQLGFSSDRNASASQLSLLSGHQSGGLAA